MKFYKAFVWLLFALFTFFSTSFATGVYPLTASRMYPYQIGEPIVITIPIEELYLNGNEAIGITTLSPEATESPYGYEIQSNYMPYSFEIRQSQRINGNYYDWHNQQLHWIELTAIANIVGSFEGCVSIYNKSNPTQKTRCLDFSFEIANTISSPSGVAIMFADSAASFEKQIEINSFLKSVDGQNHTLHNAYIQYYLTKSETSIPIFDVWWSPGHTCNKIYKCENNNYIIRQYLKDYWNITPNAPPKATAQVGYRENPNLYSQILGDKVTYYNEMYSSMRDYSYTDPAITANSRAYERNAHYNDKIVLFSESGEVLWGNKPAYESFVNCNEGVLGSDFLSETYGNDYWCSETESSSSSIIPRSSSSNTDFIIRSSSSSNASAFHDLSILFADGEPNNVYYGQFKFKIANKGTSDISIGGAEIRFYYNGDDFYDTDLLNVASGSGYSTIASVSKEQCGEDQYAIKIKLSDNAVSKARNLFPEYDAIRVNVNGQNMLKNVMYSWMNNPTLTENNKVVLLDASGSLLYGTEPWVCNGYNKKKLKLVVSGHSQMADEYSPKLKTVNKHVADASARIYLTIENKGDSVIAGPVFIDFQVTHPAGHIPLIEIEGKNLSVEGQSLEFYNRNNVRMQVMRISAGNKHTFRFTLPNGINGRYKQTIEFKLLDRCLFGCEEREELQSYRWDLSDDWSALDIKHDGADIVTDKVPVYNFENKLLYGKADPSAPIYASHQNNNSSTSGTKTSLKQNHAEIGLINPNRTDAAAYAGGQILSGGDFESPWLQGWSVSEPDSLHVVKSIRAQSPQGSRHISMDAGVSISQTLNQAAIQLLADSGAVLIIWHKEGPATVSLNGNVVATLRHSNSWVVDTIPFPPFTFTTLGDYVIKITPNNYQKIYLDDAVLIPSHIAQPTTYATRFTNSGGEEIETRAYDGDKEQLVTTSERDAMGRLWKKFLPIAMECNSVEDCNSNLKTLYNPSAAISKYIAKNPDYPDAGGYPYVETQWKPDPLATKDVEGVPGAAFSITGGHVVRAFSSGVNLSGIDMLDSASLNSAIKAVYNERTYSDDYGNKANFHAAKDTDPTHLWELNLDQNGNAAFTVKDGEGRVIISGALKKASGNSYVLATRSVNELDARGNVTKSHPPMSCEYTNAPANCVAPSTYDYDSQSRVIRTVEPDAGITLTYYDPAGRVRATQTQNQIDSGKVSVVGYDHLDRTVYTGEWKTSRDSVKLRAFFSSLDSIDYLDVDSLTPGTITRTFYDRMPPINTLGVELYPVGIVPVPTYTRGRVAAVISDVRAVVDINGDTLKTLDGKDSIIRVSTANSYDKYGRVIASYAYDPTLPDSLKQLWTTTKYDLGGKVLSTTKYPYGYSFSSVIDRNVKETYVYDRLGRVSKILSSYGNTPETELARYEYYPTGSVKTVTLGNSLTLSYTYHISGAMKTATVMSADNRELYSDTLYFEDCGGNGCTPQYNGNISRMAHHMVHGNGNYGEFRDVQYTYDELNRLIKVDDSKQDVFDEIFAYDAQGRITAQRRGNRVDSARGGEYGYYEGKNRLKSVAGNIGGTTDTRIMSADSNFVYDSEGNLTEDKSKGLKILYDWRGMPIEFIQQQQPTGSSGNSLFRLTMAYDGTGRRVSKTRWVKSANSQDWEKELVTHYTGIGTEVRESFTGPAAETKVVVNMPNGLGRYGIEDAAAANANASKNFEWYLKNHLGSTMLVYGTVTSTDPTMVDIGARIAAYDYRAFGEMLELTPPPTDKVTENFTGKELDEEIALSYFGARYLDPMLGMWTSVDSKRQFASPYLYAGNGVNPINGVDDDGNEMYQFILYAHDLDAKLMRSMVGVALNFKEKHPNADYRIVVPKNNVELMKIVNEGQHSVILAHGYEDYENVPIANLFGAVADDEYAGLDMTYEDLNAGLMSKNSVTIFSCFSSWSDDLSNVKPFRGGDQSSAEFPFRNDYSEVFGISGAKDAVNVLERQYERDNGYSYDAY